MQIRPALESDLPAMREIFQAVVATGDTLPFSSSMPPETFHSHWFGAHRAYVAADDSGVIGMYKVGANYPDLGSHIGSATYLVSPAAQSKGVGRALVTHSIEQARSDGFMAMQFNYVVSTNAPAVALYEKLGFAIVGTLPQAFRHATLGLVDAYVMYKPLQ
ncbi:GNAT family N-acetyltransferase [Duganella sp. FT92W]|uniref:GNAT family N-acetyltransferase n=1 Tax=Pseudoduganella rivuli TaxID=2666085 RepID=A0A7X2LTA8_9BURK|nr:N-acetyltransferase [Pseudoduganella rivuli]MRV73111.1 GNAT family N-acetyltransferase [Pseudoduganella rivuli]